MRLQIRSAIPVATLLLVHVVVLALAYWADQDWRRIFGIFGKNLLSLVEDCRCLLLGLPQSCFRHL